MSPPRLTSIPFPAARFIPGHTTSGPRPPHTPPLSPHWPADPTRWRESLDYLWGIDLFNAGYTWESHEALEVVWKQLKAACDRNAETAVPAAGVHRAAARTIQVFIQSAAARLKHEVGNAAGVQTLLVRAETNAAFVTTNAGNAPLMGVQLSAWFKDVRAWFETGAGAFPVLRPN